MKIIDAHTNIRMPGGYGEFAMKYMPSFHQLANMQLHMSLTELERDYGQYYLCLEGLISTHAVGYAAGLCKFLHLKFADAPLFWQKKILKEMRNRILLSQNYPIIKGFKSGGFPQHGKYFKDMLEQLNDQKILSIRHVTQFEPDDSVPNKKDFFAGINLLIFYNLNYELAYRFSQIDNIIELCESCPNVTLCINHLGRINPDKTNLSLYIQKIKRLGKLKNVYMILTPPCQWAIGKPRALFFNVICALTMSKNWNRKFFNIDNFLPYISPVFEYFGFEKVMYASDWPLLMPFISITDWISYLNKMLLNVSATDIDNFFYGNAKKIYKLT